MKDSRLASLDFLRGCAALAVAIPHFFIVQHLGERLAESISIIAVEIFFVLSGYVLAPQILFYVFEKPDLHNAGIFLVRRWMRTLPPYMIALVLATATAHEFMTADFFRYAVYLQNFVRQSNASDYFSIAWSLSVEEWFYLLFPPFMAGAALLLPPSQMRAALAAAGFILTIGLLRLWLGDCAQWGTEVRRIVAFRMDAIAWGFLLHLALTRTELLTRIALPYAVSAFLGALSIAVVLTLELATTPSLAIEHAFPFYTAALGASAIMLALKADAAFRRHELLTRLGGFLGRISYSTYLFHLLVLSALSRAAAFGWFVLLVVYLGATVAVAALMYTAVEAPILAARPRFRGGNRGSELGCQ